eukprot:TRINITY_DN37634_c0_g1_i1.p1 TRINITY_DN37634_c0_g1~~TRINITY_DN37634_c0_g1_i1.p1  ORF type:complete len:144 (+),score=29.36 TRINITY_DN37634_c0_g1_i1:49-480(+)
MSDAISLTKRMDELLSAKDIDGLKTMYHPDVVTVKPNGELIQGFDANWSAFENFILKQFPNMKNESTDFVAISENAHEKTSTCSYQVDTLCNNEAIVVDGIVKLAANAVYRVKKQNTFKDGLLFQVKLETDPQAVICRNGKVE